MYLSQLIFEVISTWRLFSPWIFFISLCTYFISSYNLILKATVHRAKLIPRRKLSSYLYLPSVVAKSHCVDAKEHSSVFQNPPLSILKEEEYLTVFAFFHAAMLPMYHSRGMTPCVPSENDFSVQAKVHRSKTSIVTLNLCLLPRCQVPLDSSFSLANCHGHNQLESTAVAHLAELPILALAGLGRN